MSSVILGRKSDNLQAFAGILASSCAILGRTTKGGVVLGESNEWTWLVLAAVVVLVIMARPYFNKRRTYTPIPPEARAQWNTWPCPSCGAQNHPSERSEDGSRVRGICSACKKTWDGIVGK